jgi:hypothetical protein
VQGNRPLSASVVRLGRVTRLDAFGSGSQIVQQKVRNLTHGKIRFFLKHCKIAQERQHARVQVGVMVGNARVAPAGG